MTAARSMLPTLLLAMVLGLTLTAPVQATERTTMDERLVTPGKLTVGTGDPVYPPWML